MSPEIFARLIDGGIPLIGGIFASLQGYRMIGKKPGVSVSHDEWHRRYGSILRIGGPLLILFGLSRIMCASAGSDAPQANWQRYTTPDGFCSVDFPEPPKREKITEMGLEHDRLVLIRSDTKDAFSLTMSTLSSDAPSVSLKERYDAIKNKLPSLLGSSFPMNSCFAPEAVVLARALPPPC